MTLWRKLGPQRVKSWKWGWTNSI